MVACGRGRNTSACLNAPLPDRETALSRCGRVALNTSARRKRAASGPKDRAAAESWRRHRPRRRTGYGSSGSLSPQSVRDERRQASELTTDFRASRRPRRCLRDASRPSAVAALGWQSPRRTSRARRALQAPLPTWLRDHGARWSSARSPSPTDSSTSRRGRRDGSRRIADRPDGSPARRRPAISPSASRTRSSSSSLTASASTTRTAC